GAVTKIRSTALACAGIFAAVLASTAATAAGENSGCVDIARMRETRAVDDRTIVVTLRGGGYQRMALNTRCVGLRVQNGFAYATSIPRLCVGDTITVLGGAGDRCGISAITPLSNTEAKALLSQR